MFEVQTKRLEVQSGINEVHTIGTGSDLKFESRIAEEMDLFLHAVTVREMFSKPISTSK